MRSHAQQIALLVVAALGVSNHHGAGAASVLAPATKSAPATPRYLYDNPSAHLEIAFQAPQYPSSAGEGWVHVWGDPHAKRAVVAMTAPKGNYPLPTASQQATVHALTAQVQRTEPTPFAAFLGVDKAVGVHWVEGDQDVWVATLGTWSSAEATLAIAERSQLKSGRLTIGDEPGMSDVAEGPPGELTSFAWGASWTVENLASKDDAKVLVQIRRYDPRLAALIATFWHTSVVGGRSVNLSRFPDGGAGDLHAVWLDGTGHIVIAITHAASDDEAVSFIRSLRKVGDAEWRGATAGRVVGMDEWPPTIGQEVPSPLATGRILGGAWTISSIGDRCFDLQFGTTEAAKTVCRSPTLPVMARIFGDTGNGELPLIGVAPSATKTVDLVTSSGIVVRHAVLAAAADAAGGAAGFSAGVRAVALAAPASDRALTLVARDAAGTDLGRTAVLRGQVWLDSDPEYTWPVTPSAAGRVIERGNLEGQAWTLLAPSRPSARAWTVARSSTGQACALVQFAGRTLPLGCPTFRSDALIRATWVVPLRRRFLVVFVGPDVHVISVRHADGRITQESAVAGEFGIGPIGRIAVIPVPPDDEVVGLEAGKGTLALHVPGDRWAAAWWTDSRVELSELS